MTPALTRLTAWRDGTMPSPYARTEQFHRDVRDLMTEHSLLRDAVGNMVSQIDNRTNRSYALGDFRLWDSVAMAREVGE